MALRIDPPPALSGDAVAQLRTLHGYLYRMAETLNLALEDVERAERNRTTVQKYDASLRELIGNTNTDNRREQLAMERRLQARCAALEERLDAMQQSDSSSNG